MLQVRANRWMIITGACLSLVVIVILGLVGYRQYVLAVPPFTPQLPAMPQPNGFDRAEAAIRRQFPQGRVPVPVGWPQPNPRELRPQWRKVAPLLDELRSTFALEWRAPPNLHQYRNDYLMAHELHGFLQCARWFAAESSLAMNQGDPGAALHRSLDAMELGALLSHGAIADFRSLAGAAHAIGFNEAERMAELIPRRDLPGALHRARQLRERWSPLADLLESERLMMLASLTRDFPRGLGWIYLDNPSFSRWERLRMAWIPRRRVLSNIDQWYRYWIKESQKPVPQRRAPAPPSDPWSRSMVRGEASSLLDPWRWERMPTESALLEVFLAARIHRFARGRYPKRLEEFDPRWLPSVPNDLWGRPIAYRLQSDGPLVYSLGPDGIDDDGRAVNPVRLSPGTRGDLVFGKLSSTRWPRAKGVSSGLPGSR